MNRKEILSGLEKGVIDGDVDSVMAIAKNAITDGLDPLDLVENGLAKGVRTVGEGFGRGELFLTELAAAAEAMKAGLNFLAPLITQQKKTLKTAGRFIIGTVSGDIHDIGKSIVASMLLANGFEVIDLGVDVPCEVFVEKVKELQPDILGLSALLSTTRLAQMDIINGLKKAGTRDKVKVIIGGAATSPEWAREIGADEWAGDAMEGVAKAKNLVPLRSIP